MDEEESLDGEEEGEAEAEEDAELPGPGDPALAAQVLGSDLSASAEDVGTAEDLDAAAAPGALPAAGVLAADAAGSAAGSAAAGESKGSKGSLGRADDQSGGGSQVSAPTAGILKAAGGSSGASAGLVRKRSNVSFGDQLAVSEIAVSAHLEENSPGRERVGSPTSDEGDDDEEEDESADEESPKRPLLNRQKGDEQAGGDRSASQVLSQTLSMLARPLLAGGGLAAILGTFAGGSALFHSMQCESRDLWSDWSDCSSTCGEGLRSRHRPHRKYCGNLQPGQFEEHKKCESDVICPDRPCKLGEWQAWMGCDLSCGPGISQSRFREVVEQPGVRGRPCPALVEVARCALPPPCPESCEDYLRDWQDWSKCASSCEVGRRWRTRAYEDTLLAEELEGADETVERSVRREMRARCGHLGEAQYCEARSSRLCGSVRGAAETLRGGYPEGRRRAAGHLRTAVIRQRFRLVGLRSQQKVNVVRLGSPHDRDQLLSNLLGDSDPGVAEAAMPRLGVESGWRIVLGGSLGLPSNAALRAEEDRDAALGALRNLKPHEFPASIPFEHDAANVDGLSRCLCASLENELGVQKLPVKDGVFADVSVNAGPRWRADLRGGDAMELMLIVPCQRNTHGTNHTCGVLQEKLHALSPSLAAGGTTHAHVRRCLPRGNFMVGGLVWAGVPHLSVLNLNPLIPNPWDEAMREERELLRRTRP